MSLVKAVYVAALSVAYFVAVVQSAPQPADAPDDGGSGLLGLGILGIL